MRSKIIFIFLNPVWLFYAALEDIDSESMRSFILTVAPHKKITPWLYTPKSYFKGLNGLHSVSFFFTAAAAFVPALGLKKMKRSLT